MLYEVITDYNALAIISMDDFIKYVNPGQEDKDWGLYLNCVGKASIEPGVIYPPNSHPSGYYFSYERGRILSEYQINYITEGAGIYENQGGKSKIYPGSLIFVKPGECVITSYSIHYTKLYETECKCSRSIEQRHRCRRRPSDCSSGS